MIIRCTTYSKNRLGRITPFIMLLLLLSSLSCVESFRPDLGEEEAILVVDGMINDLPGPYTVKLSLSSDPYKPVAIPVSGAMVSIIEEGGMEEELTETEAGIYSTSVGGIQGVVGNNYKIKIQTAGKTYESTFQKIKAAVPIISLTAEVENQSFEDKENVPGYQFYMTTTTTGSEDDYYLWLQEGTYKYISPYLLAFIYDNEELTPVVDPFEFKVCYGTHEVGEVSTLTTKNLDDGAIQNIPLSFLRSDTRFLGVRYSLEVQQHILSKAAYDYWNNVEKQVEALGSLYAAQPFRIRGNIRNTNDEEEEVLGYFTVAGTSKKRVFVDPVPGILPFEPDCLLDPVSYRNVWRNPAAWPANVHAETGGGLFVFNNGCIDCRNLGGVIEVPDFWE